VLRGTLEIPGGVVLPEPGRLAADAIFRHWTLAALSQQKVQDYLAEKISAIHPGCAPIHPWNHGELRVR
jgi:hypothetical protein